MGFQVDQPGDCARSKDGRLKIFPPDLSEYKFSDSTAEGDPQYFGYVDKDENWYIMKLTATTARYVKGSGDYAANFALCAEPGAFEYDYYFNVF